jgi:hypothetical protein
MAVPIAKIVGLWAEETGDVFGEDDLSFLRGFGCT